MARYHHISSLADEEILLSKIIDLESKIRKQKESQRLEKNIQTEKYTNIFEPITKSVESLKKPEPVEVVDDLIELPTDVKPNILEPSDPVEPNLYQKALQMIPRRSRDDGVFGLDSLRRQVSGRPYWIEGNLLLVNNEDGTLSEIQINDLEVWIILLSQNPRKFVDLPDSAVRRYREIADELNLVPHVQFTNKNFKNRVKYKLLKPHHEGTGFLFSTKKPSSMTVVIPSDKEGLLRALLQAVAELRGGNESIRNLVVPLAQEAERKNILPKGLLSPEELTWVYA